MARQKKKYCICCYVVLSGRRDAKTCSVRCRKRAQRARLLFESSILTSAKTKQVTVALAEVESARLQVSVGRNNRNLGAGI